jgi:uncharacterized lipoprotein YajG
MNCDKSVFFRLAAALLETGCATSSTKLFQVPQAGHFPFHFADSNPHS